MKLVRNTPEEEAAINTGIAADPDNPERTDADFARGTWLSDMTPDQLATMVPPEAATAELRRRGPQLSPKKEMVSIRLDRDLLQTLRAQGQGWQAKANDMLRKAVGL